MVDLSNAGPRGRDAIDIFVRSYGTLLRSTGEVRIAGLIEPYLAMAPSLHARARDLQSDPAAITYAGLRLPACMAEVHRVLLGSSLTSMARRGFTSVPDWEMVSAPARRRRQYFDGHDQLAVQVPSPSDVDDVIPALIAYEVEWNKMHELFERDAALKRLVQRAASEGPQAGDRTRLAEAMGISEAELARLSIVWQGRAWELLTRVAANRKRLTVRMLGGSWNDYERSSERWYDAFRGTAEIDFGTRPVYLVSSNMHSLVNILSGSALAEESGILDYIAASGNEELQAEYAHIMAERVPSSRENFLYYAAKKYVADPRFRHAQERITSAEHGLGMRTAHMSVGPDVDGQVIELQRLDPARMDPRLADLPGLDRLRQSDALILNIDYPLGQAAYFLQRTLARHVGTLLGVYVMGKGATLTGRVGDVLICNIVADERTQNTYLLQNCFNAEDVEKYLLHGTALDNQRAATVRGTFLQNWDYLDLLHRAGNNLVEMEAGPYLEALTEQVLPERAPRGEVINLVGSSVDVGFVHYASDTPYTKGQTLGERNLSYYGVDSTYASALAVARRVLSREVARLTPREGASVATDHAAQPLAVRM